MRVLFIISNFPPYIGGAERQAFFLARSLRSEDVHVDVLTRYFKGLRHDELINGIQIYRRGLPLKRKVGSFLSAMYWQFFLIRFGKNYQVYHAHQPYSSLLVAIIGKLLWNRPVFVKIPGTKAINHIICSRFKQAALKHFVDVVIVVNRDNQKALIDLGLPRNKIKYLPNGVDTSTFTPTNNKAQQDDHHSVVYVGRLVDTNGIDFLLKSWVKIEQTLTPKPHLFILGDGPERSSLEMLKGRLGLKNVIFTGMVNDVHKYLTRATVYVNPSTLEGLSNALLEAMSVGLPIVATNIEGTRDIIKDGYNGVLVAPRSPEALSLGILYLLDNPEVRMHLGNSARQTVLEQFGIQAVSKKYKKLYNLVSHKSANK